VLVIVFVSGASWLAWFWADCEEKEENIENQECVNGLSQQER